ncbi:tRNA pseudouridine(38-40) synthase TruA [Robiginitalea sp.]|jgi:tRNA pseudouridine38-40 synthase|uniref:tRNA pseudouridine(38-40) synthase TruA n=2 Tax=Robiginitalea sp. TaxID=1902411 RepID=UPI003C772D06
MPKDSMRYFLQCSFFGKHYHGWQRQPTDLSVQEVLEDCLGKLLGSAVEIVGAGRTDAGVHARVMYAHFDWPEPLPAELIHRLNAFLPGDIAVQQIFPVQPEAHARFDALSRTYQYFVVQQKDPFSEDTAFYQNRPLDFKLMNQAAAYLLEFEDFKAFSKSRTDVKTYLCNITHAQWQEEGTRWVFTITADRFLRNMVRAIVGTLLEVGKGNLGAKDVKTIIKSRDRSRAGASVPAKGLYLTGISYPKQIHLSDGKRKR